MEHDAKAYCAIRTAPAGNDNVRPRYEFRVWAERFDAVARSLPPLAVAMRHEDRRSEYYLVPAEPRVHSVKLRSGKLEIKTLIGTDSGLELWRPAFETALPVAGATLGREVFARLGVPPATLGRSAYSAEALIDEVVAPHPALDSVKVIKQRLAYDLDDAQAEVTAVSVGEQRYHTVALEAEDATRVNSLIARLGLGSAPNVAYPRALRAILTGRQPWRADHRGKSDP